MEIYLVPSVLLIIFVVCVVIGGDNCDFAHQ